MERLTEEQLERRLFRLSIQIHRRGLFMPMWNLREIVKNRLMRRLFISLRKERRHEPHFAQ